MSKREAVDELRDVVRAIAELEDIARAEPVDRERLRGWAMRQFAALVRVEQGLAAKPAPAPAAPPAPGPEGALLRSLEQLAGAGDRESLATALGVLCQLTGAQRGFIAVRAPGGALEFPAARAFAALDLEAPEAQLSRSILQAALAGSAPLLIDDAQADQRFGEAPSVMDLALRAVLVVPLAARGRPFGVLYLDNPTAAGAFKDEARRAAEEFARLAGPLLERDLADRRARGRRAERAARLHAELGLAGAVGESESWLAALELAARVARTDAVVLLRGETGTGKELVARAVHQASRRAAKALVTVNCGALPENLLESELFGHEKGAFTGAAQARPGRFELADGGTLFLDEVGELTPAAQVRLLRVLQEGTFERVGGTQTRRVDVRVVAATHRDLAALVAEGRFREDLRYRLDVFRIELPPLREREDDLAQLAAHFLAEFARAHGSPGRRLSPAALAAVEGYRWPGNVRELRNALERASVLARGEEIGPEALPPEVLGSAGPAARPEGLKEAVRAYKLRLVERALAEGGSHDAAAQLLGVHPKYLYKLIRDLKEGRGE